MSGPVALKGAAIGLKAGGALLGGSKRKKAAEYNAAVSEQEAQQAIIEAGIEEERQRQLARKVIGGARAQIGASGIAAQGSALDVLADSAAQAERDALTIRYRGTVQAQRLRTQADISRAEGKTAQQAGYISAASALTSGAYEIFQRRG